MLEKDKQHPNYLAIHILHKKVLNYVVSHALNSGGGEGNYWQGLTPKSEEKGNTRNCGGRVTHSRP